MKTIEITISPTGETHLQTKGFAGSSCRDASKALEAALGNVTSDSPTAELHQAASNSQRTTTGDWSSVPSSRRT